MGGNWVKKSKVIGMDKGLAVDNGFIHSEPTYVKGTL